MILRETPRGMGILSFFSTAPSPSMSGFVHATRRSKPTPVKRTPPPPATRPTIKISVVLPTFNERQNLIPAVAAVREALGSGEDWELIVVDDDSPDETWKQAEQLTVEDRRIRSYRRFGARGLSSAIVTGLGLAAGESLVVMDADLQHDATKIPALVAALDNAPLALGTRYAAGGSVGLWSPVRRALSRLASLACNLVLGIAVSDPMSGFFAIRRESFQQMSSRLNPRGYKLLMEMLAVMGPTEVAEVPYVFAPRQRGESKLSPVVLGDFAFALIELLTRSIISPRFVKYALVGTNGILVFGLAEWSLVTVATSLSFGRVDVIAWAVSMLSNYALNNLWTFRDRGHRSAPQIFRGVVLFGSVCAVGALINWSVSAGLAAPLGQMGWPALAAPAGFAIATLWNYFLNHDLTWRGHALAA